MLSNLTMFLDYYCTMLLVDWIWLKYSGHSGFNVDYVELENDYEENRRIKIVFGIGDSMLDMPLVRV